MIRTYRCKLKYRNGHVNYMIVAIEGTAMDACAEAKRRSTGQVQEVWARQIAAKKK